MDTLAAIIRLSEDDRAMSNLDDRTVAGFGLEWSTYDQSILSDEELQAHFDGYFAGFPWESLGPTAEGFDLGCGSGRWARLVAPRVAKLHCIDASVEALAVARSNLADARNCHFHRASVDAIPLPDDAMDFGYALGVLHHVPDPQAALRNCVTKLRQGAPFLLYLYYAFDNQPAWYRALWRVSDTARRVICRLPDQAKLQVTAAIARGVYWPFARLAMQLERWGLPTKSMPLSSYRNASFYTMKTDALDRFGTALEHRFTQSEIRATMVKAGLSAITFSETPPYWCVVGRRAW